MGQSNPFPPGPFAPMTCGGHGIHLRSGIGALRLWPSVSAIGWLVMTTLVVTLARSGTRGEHERVAGTGVTRHCSEPTTGPAPSRGSPGR